MDIFNNKDTIVHDNAVIKIIGVGGGGSNAVAYMFSTDIEGVECIAANTDAKALNNLKVDTIIPLGNELTKGLGAGANPEIGRESAIENRDKIAQILSGSDMVFITAGMGGGTGTGASPIIAEVAKELGILTVAVITKPFHFEGKVRQKIAVTGVELLAQQVDAYIVIPNDRLLPVLGDTTLVEAFNEVNKVLWDAVCGISDLIIRPGLIGLDFADVRAVMANMGTTMIGTGISSSGNKAAAEATEQALSSPLLENIDLQNARGILVNVSGDGDLSLKDFTEIGNMIRNIASEDATIVIGVSINPVLHDQLKVTVVATGFGVAIKEDIGLTVPSVAPNKKEISTLTDIPTLGGAVKAERDDQINRSLDKNSDNEEEHEKQYSYLDVPTFIRKQKS